MKENIPCFGIRANEVCSNILRIFKYMAQYSIANINRLYSKYSSSIYNMCSMLARWRIKFGVWEQGLDAYSLRQWFPTTVPRNTSVPQAGPKCSAKFLETLKFILKCRILGFKCSVRGFFFGLKCSAWTLPGLKCSISQKRLGTTALRR
jgi:hypothetical protein